MVAFLCAATSLGSQDVYDEPPPSPPKFEDGIIGSETIHHPLLEKVFPGVEFIEETSACTMPHSKRIVAIFSGKTWRMTAEFNVLYGNVSHSVPITVDERLEAFVRLMYWPRDPNVKILTREPVNIKRIAYTLNHRLVIEREAEVFGIRHGGIKTEILIALDLNQITSVEVRDDFGKGFGTPGIFRPILINSLDDSLGDWKFHTVCLKQPWLRWSHTISPVSESPPWWTVTEMPADTKLRGMPARCLPASTS